MMPFFFLVRDNAPGVTAIDTRFCVVLFAILHSAYYVGMISQEAGRSRWHRVEGVNGVAIRALTGGAFDLPMLVPENAPDDVKQAAQDAVRDEIIREFPVTYKSGGAEDGFVSAERPRSTALACGFEFRTPELRAFVEAGKRGVNALNAFLADADSLKPIPSFDNPLGSSGALELAWRLLHSSGPLACTKSTAHSFEYKYNPANPGCPPPDPANVQAAAILEALFPGNGYLPQPRPAQDRDGVGTAYQYANLDEVLRRGGATAVDEFYPKSIIDAILAADPSLLELFTANHAAVAEAQAAHGPAPRGRYGALRPPRRVRREGGVQDTVPRADGQAACGRDIHLRLRHRRRPWLPPAVSGRAPTAQLATQGGPH